MFEFGNCSHLRVLVLCILIFVFYQYLIYSSPTIYWDDAHIRWAMRDQLLLGRWLPVLQVVVILSSKITSSLYVLKTILSVIAIGTLLITYAIARHLFSAATGFIAIIFLAFNAMYAALGIVPYAEVLFVGLALLAFYLLDTPGSKRRFYLGIVILNLASLTSYAGWFLSVVLVLKMALQVFSTTNWKFAIRRTLTMSALCSLGPIAWLTFGVSESGNLQAKMWSIFAFVAAPAPPTLSDHILSRLKFDYVLAYSSQYFHLLTWQAGIEFLILGAIGFLFALSEVPNRRIHLGILSFLVLHWCALAFLQPWKFGSLRQPFLLQAFILLYAAQGLVQGISWLSERFALKSERLKLWALFVPVLILSARLIPSTTKFVIENLRDPNSLHPFEIGSWIEAHLEADDVILVLDDTDYYPYALATYMEYPLERILDDRFETRMIQENLAKAQKAYVIALYSSEDGLSSAEIRIMEDLESGLIRSERWAFGATNVWYVSAREIVYSP